MDAQKVDMFLMTNSSKLPASHIPIIRDRLLEMDESKLIYLQGNDNNAYPAIMATARYAYLFLFPTSSRD